MKISEIIEEHKGMASVVNEYKSAICKVIVWSGHEWLEKAQKDLRVSTKLLVTEYEKALKEFEDFRNIDMMKRKKVTVKNNPKD